MESVAGDRVHASSFTFHKAMDVCERNDSRRRIPCFLVTLANLYVFAM